MVGLNGAEGDVGEMLIYPFSAKGPAPGHGKGEGDALIFHNRKGNPKSSVKAKESNPDGKNKEVPQKREDPALRQRRGERGKNLGRNGEVL